MGMQVGLSPHGLIEKETDIGKGTERSLTTWLLDVLYITIVRTYYLEHRATLLHVC